MAIRWHMGFSGTGTSRLVGKAFAKYPLAFALSVADMEATYFPRGRLMLAAAPLRRAPKAALPFFRQTMAPSGGGRAQERKQFAL